MSLKGIILPGSIFRTILFYRYIPINKLRYRIETFRLLIAVTILTCQTDRQRAETINDWIRLAVETKTALGNLYGFSAIMFGLCMPQVRFKIIIKVQL